MDETIFGIYTFKHGYYELVHLFSNLHNIDQDIIRQTFKTIFKNRKISTIGINEIGPFENQSEMNKYGFSLCQELNANQINIMSADQFNNSVHEITATDSFLTTLSNSGEIIENIEKKKSKKWDKFFL